jgi:hypothetical protein
MMHDDGSVDLFSYDDGVRIVRVTIAFHDVPLHNQENEWVVPVEFLRQ